MRVTAPLSCTWLDHSGSGLKQRTERPVQTRFRCAFAYRLKLARYSKSLTHYTKGTTSPRVTHEWIALGPRLFVGVRFQVYFTPLVGCFSPFPHGTCSLSVAEEYLGLEGGPPMFRQGFTCPALLKSFVDPIRVRGCHLLRPIFPGLFRSKSAKALAWSAFARHY
jgi:hypothetical protein